MHEQLVQTNSRPPASELPVLAVIAMLIGNAALAFGPWFVRLADVGPVAVGFWRLALAVPILLAVTFGSSWRPSRLSRGLWGAVVIGGLCFAADLALWNAGIVRTTLANATLFGNSATLFYPIYGFIIARSLPTRAQGLALVLAAIGAALLMGRSYQVAASHLVGDTMCLFAGILYACYLIFMAQACKVLAPLPVLLLSTIAGALPLLLFSLAIGERLWPHHWGPLIGIALSSQVLGQGLLIYALGRLPPLIVGIALLTQPIISGTVGWLAYGEMLGAADLTGAVLIAAALVLVRRREPVATPC